MTLREKWNRLAPMFNLELFEGDILEDGIVCLSENIIPSEGLLQAIIAMEAGDALQQNGTVFAWRYHREGVFKLRDANDTISLLNGAEDLFLLTGAEIVNDFNLLAKRPLLRLSLRQISCWVQIFTLLNRLRWSV
ncbi:hypothetical protein KUH03_10805 [Sphingobacterium sp. E70]|nr:hypothetical protein KUH03_10805 [Sphingobacterium sp. E70]